MFLYLVRHGEARKEGEDPTQGLTQKGIEDVKKVAAYAQKASVHVDQIFHSPKARAHETTKILAEYLKPEKGIDQSDNLLPMDDPGLWAMRIAGMNEDVMLVGHLPFMAKLAGLLLCGDTEEMCVDFKAGGILCLKRTDNGWVIEWMLVPEIVG